MQKTAMFYIKNCDLGTLFFLYFSSAIITQLTGGAILTKTSSSHDVCMVTERLKFLVYLEVLPQSRTKKL